MRALLVAGCVALAGGARAATLTGGDYNGAALQPANGDVLSGTFLNVGLFDLAAGATVFAAPGATLVIYASTMSIAGTIDASGRGQPGGTGGVVGAAGAGGFGGGPAGAGAGSGGAAARLGAGGGAYGGAGGSGAGGTPAAAGGAVNGSTGAETSPLSADDVYLGSGGGGGGGGSAVAGGNGGAGGGAVYLEASSVTITGAILLQGATAATSVFNAGTNPGGGGGGSGGGLLLRVTGPLSLSGARLSANGGRGGDVGSVGGSSIAPGGGGGGGRIKIFSNTLSAASVILSTAAGTAGNNGGVGGTLVSTVPTAGAAGAVSFGVVASSPTALAAQTVYATSVAWNWSAAPSFGDAPPASQAYRLFASGAAAPLSSPVLTAAAGAASAVETGLTPNTTYYRFATAYTDWGDGLPSNVASTHTLASPPAAAATPFPADAATGLTAEWTAGSPANPAYTVYEIQSALDAGFTSSVQTGFAVALSSSPSGLSPNTTYFVRVRALNLDGAPTAYTAAMSTATLAQAPASPAFGPVLVTSASFSWSAGANPPDTLYQAEISSDNFFTLVASSETLLTSAAFSGLMPGTQYFFRARALNRASVASSYSAVISTRAGILTNTSPPSAPGTPVPDRSFSYTGTVTFAWPPAQSPVGILNYELLLGTFPGGNDVFNGTVSVASYTATGLATGKTYYAQTRARSNAGSVGPFSSVSAGVQVFRAASTPAIAEAYAWPNPFNPGRGAVQIGFFLEQAADVTFRIYTLQGRLIREFSRSFGTAGNQVASWDGSDDSGRRVASGGYIVQVKRGGGGSAQRVKIAVLDR